MSTSEHKRVWLPEEFADEISPRSLESPDDFIRRTDEGNFVLSARDEDDNFILEGDFTFSVPLAQGDVVVFWPYEDYGAFSVWVDADGKYRTDAFFPALANNFYVQSDWDAYGTFGELIESDSFADALKSDPKPTICIGQSFPGVSFRFDIDSDGNPRFVRQAWVN